MGISAFLVPTDAPGLSGRQGRAQAGTRRIRHLRAALRQSAPDRRPPARRAEGAGLPHCARQSRGRAHRHRRAVDRDGAGGAGDCRRLCQGAPARWASAIIQHQAVGLPARGPCRAAGSGAPDGAARCGREGRRACPALKEASMAKLFASGGGGGRRLRRDPDAGRLWLSRRVRPRHASIAMCAFARSTRAPPTSSAW